MTNKFFDKNKFSGLLDSQIKLLFALVILPLYFLFGSIIVTAIIKFVIVTGNFTVDYTTVNVWLNFLFDLMMLIISILIFKDVLKKQWGIFKRDFNMNMIYGCLIGLGLMLGASYIGGIITFALQGGVQSSANQGAIESMLVTHKLLMILPTVLFAPILEEIIFRGMLFGWIYELSPKLAHVFSGFIFGFIHIMNSVMSGDVSEWAQIFSYMFMGMVLSYLYEKRNTIYVPMLAHVSNNLLSVIMILSM